MAASINVDYITGTLVVKPTDLSKEGKLLEVRIEHGEQHRAPDTEVHVLEFPDGTKVERSFSVSFGRMGRIVSGFTERRV